MSAASWSRTASRRSRRSSRSTRRGGAPHVEVRAEPPTPPARRRPRPRAPTTACTSVDRRPAAPPRPGRRHRPRRPRSRLLRVRCADQRRPSATLTAPPDVAARASRRTPSRRGRSCAGSRVRSGSKTARRRVIASRSSGENKQRHLRDLLDADAVLAGDAAAERDARLEDLPAGREHALDLVRVALVEEDDRVDVAVAGVEDVADAEAVALGRRRDRAQDLGHARARHDAVLRAVVRREAPDGAERPLARLPERGALGVVARRRRTSRAPCRPAERVDARGLRRRARPRGRRSRSAARRRRRSAGRRGTPPRPRRGSGRSIISSAAGTMPAAMIRRHRLARRRRPTSKTASSVR